MTKKYLFKPLISLLMLALLLTVTVLPVFALEDGAYTVERTTSYADFETGEIVDGGTNQALGDSMCAGVLEENALVEVSQGKTYITLGVGLMSNLENIEIYAQTTSGAWVDGVYEPVELTQTGESEMTNDTCIHYRFELPTNDLSLYISLKMYVIPMERDVQFFIQLNEDTAQPGTGIFASEMVGQQTAAVSEPEVSEEAEASESPSPDVSEEPEVSEEPSASEAEETPVADDNSEGGGISTGVIIGIVVVIIVIIAVFVVVKRRKS